MASLARFKLDTTKLNEGSWVKLGEEYGEIEIKTRGFTDAYLDARQAKMRRAAIRYSGDLTKIPQADVRHILVDLLIQYCLLDVKSLFDENGDAVSFDLFKELITEDAYQDLYSACLAAANVVSNERAADLIEIKKTSPTPSA